MLIVTLMSIPIPPLARISANHGAVDWQGFGRHYRNVETTFERFHRPDSGRNKSRRAALASVSARLGLLRLSLVTPLNHSEILSRLRLISILNAIGREQMQLFLSRRHKTVIYNLFFCCDTVTFKKQRRPRRTRSLFFPRQQPGARLRETVFNY